MLTRIDSWDLLSARRKPHSFDCFAVFEPTGLEEVDGRGAHLCHERTAGHAGSSLGHGASAMRGVYQFLGYGALATTEFDRPR